MIASVRNTILLSRNLVEDQSDDGEDNWSGDGPESSFPIVLQNWLNTGEDDADNQNCFNEDNQNVSPETVVEDFKWPFNILLLEEWEGPNQENVWEAG